MDWKRFYLGELTSPAGRATAEAALARHAGGDSVVMDVLRRGGVVSFPHVMLRDAADPIARVVQSIRAVGARRVVALGVLHGGTLPEPHRSELAEYHAGSARAAELFRRLGGAFSQRGAAVTPWGGIPDGPAPATSDVVREDAALVAKEFSLDLFLALLAAASRNEAPPPVTRVFVSATRAPDGSFGGAAVVGHAVRELLGGDAVCVATGDLVHCGHAYSPPAETIGMPADAAALVGRFGPRIDAMHDAALRRRDFEAAYAIASEIRSDQRNLLPVISHLLGPHARAETLSLGMSDYAVVNGVAPPCFVASALVAFRPGEPPAGAPAMP